MIAVAGRFSRSDRLLDSRDFRRVAASGERSTSRDFVVLVAAVGPLSAEAAGSGSGPRLGVTVSRRVGNAVVRNRVKRAVRGWFRGARAGMRGDRDLVVIARPGAASLSSHEIATSLDRAARGAHGLWQ